MPGLFSWQTDDNGSDKLQGGGLAFGLLSLSSCCGLKQVLQKVGLLI